MSKPTIPEVINRFKEYHRKNSAWGSLHVVLDDGNVADHFVDGCILWAYSQDDSEGAELGKILKQMSKTQRLKISRML